jgi:hypothetical protein
MERFAKIARGIAILIFAGVGFIGALFYVAVRYSAMTTEFTCEGYARINGAPDEQDHGRLQIAHYRFWVALWNSKSDGSATFQSTKFAFYEGNLIISGEGNFAVYAGISPERLFSFKSATNELNLLDNQMTFKGNCIAAL